MSRGSTLTSAFPRMPATYETPIAHDRLVLRDEVSAALVSLTELALETSAPSDTIQTLGKLQAALRDPYLFIAVGETKAGKSSLLNALFGQEFCSKNDSATPGRVELFKFGEQPRELPLHPGFVERYLPAAFLRDFNVVDTPGTNAGIAEFARITAQFAPLADLILCVISVLNPWGSSVWQFLGHLQRGWLKNVVFVVQQIDLRTEREVQAVVQHLKQTATVHFGQAFPVFALSAKTAFLAKTTGLDKARLWDNSGLGPLEDYINEAVSSNEAWRGKLRGIDGASQSILADLAGVIRSEAHAVSSDRAEFERLQATVAECRSHAGLAVEAFLHGVDTAFSRCEHQGEHLLRQRLRTRAAILFGENVRWQRHFQRNLESMLHAAISHQMTHAFNLLEAETRAVWTELRASMRANLSLPAQEQLAADEVKLADQRLRLMERIETATIETLTDESTEQNLRPSILAVSHAARAPIWCAVVLAVAAGAPAAVRLLPFWVAAATGFAALLVAVGGLLAAAGKRRAALATYRGEMRARQAELSAVVAELVRQAVDTFYGRVERVYLGLEAFCEIQEIAHRPLLDRVDVVEKAFSRIRTRL